MTHYKDLVPYLIDHGGEDKYLPLSKLLDILQSRAIVISNELGIHGLNEIKTEFARGRRFELLAFIQALKEPVSGTPTSGPNL